MRREQSHVEYAISSEPFVAAFRAAVPALSAAVARGGKCACGVAVGSAGAGLIAFPAPVRGRALAAA